MKPPAEDLDRLMAVMETAFDPAYGEAWTRRQVEDALLVGNCHYFLIGESGRPASFGEEAAGFYLSRTGLDEEELLLFAVAPQYRRRGLGRLILEQLSRSARARGARRLFLEMRRGNPAESLYRKYGFSPVGERPNYYRSASGNRIDALTFSVNIA